MTKKGTLRLSVALGSTAIILTSAGVGIAFGIPNVQGSHSHLRMVQNAKNPLSWYQFDSTFSYGSFAPGAFATAGTTPHTGQLVRRAAVGENVKVIDKDKPVNDDYTLNLIDSPNKYKEFYKLELAEKVVIFKGQSAFEFNADDYDLNREYSPNPQSINSKEFIDALNDPNATSIDFVIKKDLSWVNNRGEEVKDKNGDPYTIVPEDWVYGMYRTVMTSNMQRNSPVTSSNPFGGFGELPMGQDFETWTKQWWDFSTQMQAASGYDFSTPTNGYANAYVYDLLNVNNPYDLVKPSGNPSGKPTMIGSYNGDDTISLHRKDENGETKFQDAFNEIVVRNQDLIPAPSQYIRDVSSKIDVAAGIPLPKPDGTNIVSSEINIRKYGIFTYGTTYDQTLYSGAYYVSQNDSFRTRQDLNPYYWDSDFVKSPQSVKSLTTDWFEIADQKIFAQSSLDQYNNGRIFTTDLANQPPTKVSEIKKQGQSNGLRYQQKKLNKSFVADIFPVMLPKPGASKYGFNDAFARVWFGSKIDDIQSGKMKIGDYVNKWSIAARSQMMASINWYSQSRTISENDDVEAWYSYLPPDVPFNAKNSGNKVVYDYKDQLNTLTYWVVNDNGTLEKRTINPQENIDKYNQSSKQLDSLKSAHFDEIKKEFARTIQHVLGNDSSIMEFAFANREITTLTAKRQQAMEQFVTILKELSPQLEPKLTISLSSDVAQTFWRGQTNVGEFHNWGPDYQGIGTWLTGTARARFGIQATALAIAFNDDENVRNAFPRLGEYGQVLNEKMNAKISEYFNDKGKPELKDLYDSPDSLKNKSNNQNYDISSSGMISKTLMDRQKYASLNAGDKLIVDQGNDSFLKTISAIDFELQSQKEAEWFVDLFNEQMSIMGKYFATKEIGIPTKSRYVETIWQPWLIWSILTSEIYYLQDIKIIK